jgi:lysine-specific demethylase 8
VWLAPPSVSDSMHTFSQPPFADGSTPSSSLRNTSRIDVFADIHGFSDFAEKVVPLSMAGTLGPGDALFFPPGWWHSMRSESTSFSLSMWF